MQVRAEPDTQAVIQARMDQFDLMTRVIGCESDAARAELIGMSSRAIQRARTGFVGGAFVANTITALREHERDLAARNLFPTFDSLFVVRVVPRADIEAAAA